MGQLYKLQLSIAFYVFTRPGTPHDLWIPPGTYGTQGIPPAPRGVPQSLGVKIQDLLYHRN